MSSIGTTMKVGGELVTFNSLPMWQMRSGKVSALHKAKFLAETLPKIRKAQVHVGKLLLNATDPKAVQAFTSSWCQLVEQRRVLLRIPGPGRDTTADLRTIDMGRVIQEADAMLMPEPSGQTAITPQSSQDTLSTDPPPQA